MMWISILLTTGWLNGKYMHLYKQRHLLMFLSVMNIDPIVGSAPLSSSLVDAPLGKSQTFIYYLSNISLTCTHIVLLLFHNITLHFRFI